MGRTQQSSWLSKPLGATCPVVFSNSHWLPETSLHTKTSTNTQRRSETQSSFDGVLKLALSNQVYRVVFRCWKMRPPLFFLRLFIPPSPCRWWRKENSVDYTGKPFHNWIQRVCFHQGAQQINANNTFPLMKETPVDGELTNEASSPFVCCCFFYNRLLLLLFLIPNNLK